MNKLIQRGFLNALGTIAYITWLAWVFAILEKYNFNEPDGFFAPVLALTLFVVSAAVTGGLVIGKPLLMYISGQKSEAVKLFLYTIAWLVVALVILLIVNLI